MGTVLFTLPRSAEVERPIDWDATPERHRECTARLTWAALEANGINPTAAVVCQELVHVEQVQRFGTSDHGAAFHTRAGELGAPRHCEPFGPARYLLRCDACGGDGPPTPPVEARETSR